MSSSYDKCMIFYMYILLKRNNIINVIIDEIVDILKNRDLDDLYMILYL